ncbi:10173_t:CDS:2 [Funneliformis caledonium]|uniref:10173_t:CDS:1 n=1 Tax=Funneliformis caledonium TaxID=1117310 RepID=A0A9N9C304_9GLOM|nr:10173_t:CDS:2 [Funneliformis caledonium]
MNLTKNFAEYRDILHNINPPCIPFFGLYLTDLTFIEDENPNYLKNSNKLINFAKRMKTAEVICKI